MDHGSIPIKATIKASLALFLPLLVVVWSITAAIYFMQIHSSRGYLQEITELQNRIFREQLEQEFAKVVEDIELLIHNGATQEYINHPNAQSLRALNQYWLNLAYSRDAYNQLRLLDSSGMEKVRIDWNEGNPELFSWDKQQDKSQRAYFKKGMLLHSGAVYLSPIDLNVEYGIIERPYVPVIRFVSPLFNHDGERVGLIVINYHGKRLFELLEDGFIKHYEQGHHFLLLLNQESFYLKGVQPDEEWGFLFPNRKKHRFEVDFPKVWKEMQHKPRGQLKVDGSLLTYESLTIPPKNLGIDSPSSRRLFIVNYVAGQGRLFINSFQGKGLILISLGTTLVLAIISLLWARMRIDRSLNHKALIESESRTRLILESTVEGIYGIDAEGKITFLNQAATLILGYAAHELIGKHGCLLFEDKKEEPDNNVRCRFQTALDSGHVQYSSDDLFYNKQGKPFHVEYNIAPLFMDHKIDGAVVVFRDITDRKESERLLEMMATTDALTGAWNRKKFEDFLAAELARNRRYGASLSLGIIDIDYFKQINDTFGHHAGDLVLRSLVQVIAKELRENDLLARWGGEEFVVVSPNTDIQGMQALAEKIRNSVGAYPFEAAGHITLSIGVGEYCPDESQESLFSRVDHALYNAKEGGRDRVIIAKPFKSC